MTAFLINGYNIGHSEGMYLEAQKMRVSKRTVWGAVSFKNCEGILSGPDDLCGLRFSNRFFTTSISIFNSGISGTLLQSI